MRSEESNLELLGSIADVCNRTGLSKHTLAQWRSQKKNIAYIPVGEKTWYDRRDVENYLERCRVQAKENRHVV